MARKLNSSLDLLRLAATAARRAADFISAAGKSREVTRKGHNDWASEVDRGAEAVIAEVLERGAPGSRLVAEESSPGLTREGLVWIVDPLDGTTNHLHGYPQYAVSIAAAQDGVIEAGVVLDLNRETLAGAARGLGAWEGERRLRVSPEQDPARALLGTGYPFKHLEQLEAYLAQFRGILPATSGVRRTGSAALDLADVAAGRLDGFWELMLAPWDVAAGILLIREAGGRVTDLAGRDIGVEHGPVVAGNPAIHDWLLKEVTSDRLPVTGDR
jgi:myo-inositol-1(or 4)-monophosphatase